MRGFFRGWKQKVGLLTLVIACALSVEWARSFTICDGVAVTFYRSRYSARSYRQQILWDHHSIATGQLYHPFFNHFSVEIATAQHLDPFSSLRERDWCWIAGDFYIAHGWGMAGHPSNFVPTPGPPVRYSLLIAQTPFWSIVLPLTLLSAWLLLSKPRKSKPKIVDETGEHA